MAGARVTFTLTDEERETLKRWARRPKSSQALALRCQIVLAAADGEHSKDIAARLGCHARLGLDGLHELVRGAHAPSGTTTSRR